MHNTGALRRATVTRATPICHAASPTFRPRRCSMGPRGRLVVTQQTIGSSPRRVDAARVLAVSAALSASRPVSRSRSHPTSTLSLPANSSSRTAVSPVRTAARSCSCARCSRRSSSSSCSVAVAGLLCGGCCAARGIWRMRAVHWLYLVLCLGVGPGLVTNTLLKDQWGRARPAQIVEFGGSKTFTPPLLPADQCARNCSFVSGEAASMFAVFYAVALIVPHWSVATMIAGTIVGLAAGLVRVAQGGHFLSDVVFAGVFMALIAAGLHRLMFGRPRRGGQLMHAAALDRCCKLDLRPGASAETMVAQRRAAVAGPAGADPAGGDHRARPGARGARRVDRADGRRGLLPPVGARAGVGLSRSPAHGRAG